MNTLLRNRSPESELKHFVHRIDAELYEAWYRVMSRERLEVIGVGMAEVAEFNGYDPEGLARLVLENFVREQRSLGIPVPSVRDRNYDEVNVGERPPEASPQFAI